VRIDLVYALTRTLSPGGARELFVFLNMLGEDKIKEPPLLSAGEGWGKGYTIMLSDTPKGYEC
jgi:hypothetical protein